MERILTFLLPCPPWRLWTQRWSQVLFLIIALSMKPLRKVLLLFLLSFDRTIDIQCNVDIMDHLLACEATWHNGHSFGKTVFSCICLLRPDRISSHTLLHSYCLVLMVTCNAVVSAVSEARTNEEEHLFTLAYSLPLKGEGDENCLSILHAVDEIISRQLRACKAPSTMRVLEDACSPEE